MDLRKSKTKIKHGISSRGTSDRLKQQSVNDRALKRSEITKRFRGACDITDTHEIVKLSQDALHMAVMSIKVRLQLFRPLLATDNLVLTLTFYSVDNG